MVNLALREYVKRRRRTEARLRHLERTQQWDQDGFWARHAAEKGHMSDNRADKDVACPRPITETS